MRRRLLYYHHIIKRPNTELIYKIYKAQKLKPCKGDWINLINQDEKLLNINLNEEKDKRLSKYKFKKNINKVIRESAFKYLLSKKESRSKIEPLYYRKLQTQNYLKTNNCLTDGEKITLFKLRTREANVKCNYKNMYTDLKCTLCKSKEDDNQYHLLQCEYLIQCCKNLAENILVEYEDIYESLEKQIPAAKLLHEVLKIKSKLTE